MKTQKIKGQEINTEGVIRQIGRSACEALFFGLLIGRCSKKLILVIYFLLAPTFVWATYQLPSDRTVVWQGNVGIPGGIPSRTTICSTSACVTAGSPSGGDDTSRIQAAINSCPTNQVLLLGSGTYKVSGILTISTPMVLRGQGTSSTTIVFTANSGAWGHLSLTRDVSSSYTTQANIVSGYTKGSTQIVISNIKGRQGRGRLCKLDKKFGSISLTTHP